MSAKLPANPPENRGETGPPAALEKTRVDKYGERLFRNLVTRRSVLKTLGTASAAGLMGLTFGDLARAASRKGKRPNIIFILSDDHRWDYMSCVGHSFVETRNMDRLANEGVLFSNAFVTTSLCSPSRASFLTGQYAHTHGVKNNLTVWKNENVTFMELFKGAGYDTAFIGKWHMPGRLPKLRGVDRFLTFTVQAGQGRYFDCPLIVDGTEVPSRKPYITEELTDYALEFIEKNRETPFCLYLSHKAVHHQFLPPPELTHLYDNVELKLPKETDSWIGMTRGNMWTGIFGPMERHLKNYCEALVALDGQIGRVLDKLDELGIAEDTIVVYAGDNGYFWGEHRLVDKRWPYEESIRIPLIVRYPRLIKDPGRKADQMVLNIDVAPSLLSMAGLPVPENMEGESFEPILLSESAPGRKAWLYEYFKEFPYNVPECNAVRTDTHIYVEYAGKRPAELFDVINDPRQMQNLIDTSEGKRLLPELKPLLEGLKEGRKF
ncbi:MAG: sulfatase-like hydrolase/transferase [Candidatus Hydrogenedentota bacterium]|nr:MAG: sulfatase-like hydrolase/transferase [Candidatus Hydrogenedentota bacterium]